MEFQTEVLGAARYSHTRRPPDGAEGLEKRALRPRVDSGYSNRSAERKTASCSQDPGPQFETELRALRLLQREESRVPGVHTSSIPAHVHHNAAAKRDRPAHGAGVCRP